MNAANAPTAAPYTTIVGLEVHLQLQTRTKLFCGCSTAFGAPPNTQVGLSGLSGTSWVAAGNEPRGL